jgi:hypothetical protein
MKCLSLFVKVLFVSAASLAINSRAVTLVLEEGVNGYSGTRDTTLFQDRPANSAGGFPNFFSSVTNTPSPRRTLIKFDIPTTFPLGSTLTAVSLTLEVDQSRPGTVVHALRRVTRSWNEGNNPLTNPSNIGLGAPAQAGDATWSHAVYNTTAWTTAGGDYSGTVSATASVGIAGTFVTFTSAQMLADINAWRTTPANNFGWILIGDETQQQNARRYISSESPTGMRPRLTITYTAPSGIDDWALLN